MAEIDKKDKQQRPEWQDSIESAAAIYFATCRRMASAINRLKRKKK